jgi:hypothetical protein
MADMALRCIVDFVEVCCVLQLFEQESQSSFPEFVSCSQNCSSAYFDTLHS